MRYLGIALVQAWRHTFGLLTPAGHVQVPPELLAVRARRVPESTASSRAALFAGWRLLRCNPWSHGGVDRAEDAHFGRRRHETERPA